MKRCPKCGKIYDDTWGICAIDDVKLEHYEVTEEKLDIIVTTTDALEGRPVSEYKGIVNGISITGFGAMRDFLSGFTDFFGGKSGSYHKEYHKAKELAIADLKHEASKLGADAVVCVRLDFENIAAKNKSLVMVSATGTAVKLQ